MFQVVIKNKVRKYGVFPHLFFHLIPNIYNANIRKQCSPSSGQITGNVVLPRAQTMYLILSKIQKEILCRHSHSLTPYHSKFKNYHSFKYRSFPHRG